MKKAIYQKPLCECVKISGFEALLLATRGEQAVVKVTDEDAGEDVAGLSRKQSNNVWDDEEYMDGENEDALYW